MAIEIVENLILIKDLYCVKFPLKIFFNSNL